MRHLNFGGFTAPLILLSVLGSVSAQAQMNINMKVDEPAAKKFTESLSGDIGKNREQAFKLWEESCDAWKKDLKQLNGSRLISVNCGAYHHELLKDYYASQEHRFSSKASFTLAMPTASK